MSQDTPNIELNAETLTGDIRDWLIGHFRDMQKPWAQMSESEQYDKIEAADRAARQLVTKTVNTLASENFDTVHVQVGKFTVKEGQIKAEFTAAATDQYLLSIRHAGRAVLVLADPNAYHGERQEARPDPDEPGLPLVDEEQAEVEPAGQGMPDIPDFLDRRSAADAAA